MELAAAAEAAEAVGHEVKAKGLVWEALLLVEVEEGQRALKKSSSTKEAAEAEEVPTW